MLDNKQKVDEKLYASLTQHITEDSDPLDSVIDDTKKKVQSSQSVLNVICSQLDSLVERTMPTEPTPVAKHVVKWSLGITVVVSILLLIFHCIISFLKLFAGISWNTWHMFLYALVGGLTTSLFLFVLFLIIDFCRKKKYTKDLIAYNNYVIKSKLLHERKNAQEKEVGLIKEDLEKQLRTRYNTLGYALNVILGLPFPSEEINQDNYVCLKDKYIVMYKVLNAIKESSDTVEKRRLLKQLTDKKLDFFYTQSMKVEINSDVYHEFEEQYKAGQSNATYLRRDIPVNDSKGTLELYQLDNYKKELNDNILSTVIDKFYEVSNRKIGMKWLPFITDKDKKEQQVKDLKRLVGIAEEQYEDIKKLNRHIAYALEYVRGFAYRNIYLGAELINYLRGTVGGGTLDKVNDTTNVRNIDNGSDDFSVDFLGLKQVVPSLCKDLLDFMSTNPVFTVKATDSVSFSNGASSVALVGGIIVSYINNKNAEKEDDQNREQLKDSIQAISDGYNDAKGSLERALEIIDAIVNANKGFMTIYEPLSEEVFVNGNTNLQSLKMNILQLAQAVNKYKVIADSKIK